MFLADYHTHSLYSSDGADTVEAVARAAVLMELSEVAITDHYDISPHVSYKFDAGAHKAAVMTFREKHAVRLPYSIELGDPLHALERAELIAKKGGYDFIIGSVHLLKDGTDIYQTKYTNAVAAERYLESYLDECIETAEKADFDVLGHLTYPLRYINGRDNIGAEWHNLEKTRHLFRTLISRGMGIELNVSGMMTRWGQAMPDMKLLRIYRECGGETVTVGSDSHYAHMVGKGIAGGYEMLVETGFSYVAAFSERKPRYEKLR